MCWGLRGEASFGRDAVQLSGMSQRSFRRYRHRYEEEGLEGALSE